MWNEETLRLPKNENEMWNILWEHYQDAKELFDYPLETAEEAASGFYRSEIEDAGAMTVIKYKGVGLTYCNRDRFYNAGKELLPLVYKDFLSRKLTPKFVQRWSLLMYYHGYISAHFFDDTDVDAHHRGGHEARRLQSRHAQKKWIAHHLMPLLEQKKLKRAAAEGVVYKHIKSIIDSNEFPEFGRKWFEAMIKGRDLSSTYKGKYFTGPVIKNLMLEPTDDIPPIKLLIP